MITPNLTNTQKKESSILISRENGILTVAIEDGGDDFKIRIKVTKPEQQQTLIRDISDQDQGFYHADPINTTTPRTLPDYNSTGTPIYNPAITTSDINSISGHGEGELTITN